MNILNTHKNIYKYTIYVSYLLYAIILMGLSHSAPQYLKTLDNFLKIYVSLFLIFKFNPLRKSKFTNFDRKIVFSSAIFLLTTTTITNIFITLLVIESELIPNKHLFLISCKKYIITIPKITP